MSAQRAPVELPGLFDGLVSTRAIRRYRDEEIPESVLADLLFAATRAPSGHNRQPFRFVVVRRTPEMTEVRRLLTEAFRSAWAESREDPSPDDTSRRARMARTMSHFVDHVGEAPVIVFACLRERVGPVTSTTAHPSSRPVRTCCWRPGHGATAG